MQVMISLCTTVTLDSWGFFDYILGVVAGHCTSGPGEGFLHILLKPHSLMQSQLLAVHFGWRIVVLRLYAILPCVPLGGFSYKVPIKINGSVGGSDPRFKSPLQVLILSFSTTSGRHQRGSLAQTNKQRNVLSPLPSLMGERSLWENKERQGDLELSPLGLV